MNYSEITTAQKSLASLVISYDSRFEISLIFSVHSTRQEFHSALCVRGKTFTCIKFFFGSTPNEIYTQVYSFLEVRKSKLIFHNASNLSLS